MSWFESRAHGTGALFERSREAVYRPVAPAGRNDDYPDTQ